MTGPALRRRARAQSRRGKPWETLDLIRAPAKKTRRQASNAYQK